MTRPGDHALIASRVNDLPDWLGPMFVKELRQALRTPLFLVPFAGIHVAAWIALLVEFRWLSDSVAHDGYDSVSVLHPFWGLVSLVLVGILPLRNLGALHSVMRQRNFELVYVSGLSAGRMVVGPWLVQCCLSGLVFVSVLPYIIFRYFFGGIEVVATAITIVSVLGAASAANALVLGVSGYANVGIRLGILMFSLVVVCCVGTVGMESLLNSHAHSLGNFFHLLFFFYGLLSLLMFFAFYTGCGLQLGRAHLESAIDRPSTSTKVFVAGIILSPFVLLCGSLVTCFYGIGLVLAVMLLWVWKAGGRRVYPRLK
ncbi:MAG: hypothetical protein ACI9R3_002358 [Verrucomicrobiales bacterium]|jgi:hypothetical protein